MGGIVIQMPESPGPVFALVVHQLEQVFGYADINALPALSLLTPKT